MHRTLEKKKSISLLLFVDPRAVSRLITGTYCLLSHVFALHMITLIRTTEVKLVRATFVP